MGGSGISKSNIRETPAGVCADGIKEDQRLPQGPSDTEVSVSSLPGIAEGTVIKLHGDLQPVSRNHANAATGAGVFHVLADDSSPNGEVNSLANSNDKSEEVGGFWELQEVCKISQPTGGHVQENHSFPVEGQEMAQLKGDLTWEGDTMEGRLNAHCQKTLKLNKDLRTLFQKCKDELLEQKGLCDTKQKEVAFLKGENQQLRPLVTLLRSRVGEVSELKDMILGMKTEIGQLRQEIKLLPSVRDDILDQDIGKAFGQLLRDKRALHKDLSKCHTELESAKHSRTDDSQKEEKLRRLEELNSKLQAKGEMMQQQLCKEMTSQYGSYVDGQQTPCLLESTSKEMFSSIDNFSALLSKYTSPAGFNPSHALISSYLRIWNISCLARENHWKHLLKSVISLNLFAHFESERFAKLDNSALFLDPEERVSTCFEYFKSCKSEGVVERAFRHESKSNHELDDLFFLYLAQISLDLLPSDIQSISCEIFKNRNEFTRVRLDGLLSRVAINTQKLVKSLIVAAEKVWQFHKLCLSFEPPATIFRVSSGNTYNQNYMESTDALDTDFASNSVPTVGFMVYPGFRLRKSIIKCGVYVANYA